MDKLNVSELLRRLAEGKFVAVLTSDGKEVAISALCFEAGRFVGYQTKWTKEIIEAAAVVAIIF